MDVYTHTKFTSSWIQSGKTGSKSTLMCVSTYDFHWVLFNVKPNYNTKDYEVTCVYIHKRQKIKIVDSQHNLNCVLCIFCVYITGCLFVTKTMPHLLQKRFFVCCFFYDTLNWNCIIVYIVIFPNVPQPINDSFILIC